MRIVSLAPSNTELIAALGLTDALVGVDDWSDWPPEVASVEKVGPDLQIDVERVAALKPDLVVASLSVPGMERVVAAVREHDLPHIVLAPKSLDAVIDQTTTLADALGVPERGETVAHHMRNEIDAVRRAAETRDPVRVYWEWWPKPAITVGRPGWMTELIAIAGGENVFADRDEESPQVSADEVAARDPDVVAACWCGSLQRVQSRKRVMAREGWDAVIALREGRVSCFPEDLFGRPGPRLVEGARSLAAALETTTTRR